MRSTFAGTILAALLLFQPVAAEADATCSVDNLELCGTTTVAGGKASSILLELDRGIDIPVDASRTTLFRLSGNGSFAAFALAPMDPDTANAILVGGASPLSSTAGTFLLGANPLLGATSYNGVQQPVGSVSTVSMGPGPYRLTVVSDEPVALTLTIPGLPGSAEYSAASISDSNLRLPANEVPSTGGMLRPAGLGSAGIASLTRYGVAVGFLRVETDAFATGQFVICKLIVSDGDPHPCHPDGGKAIYNDRAPTASPEPKVLVSTSGYLPQGRYGLGFAYTATGVATASSFVAVWIPFGPTA